MGKGFENYMSKKWFHPTNIDNMKRVFSARQKEAAEKKRQQDLRDQYEREQEVFSNKQMMGDEKARLGLSFMYNAPAGGLKDKQQQNDLKGERKLDWEKTNESAAATTSTRGDMSHVRCLKCKRLGHANTDKSCPLYGKSRLDSDSRLAAGDEEELAATSLKLKSFTANNDEEQQTAQPLSPQQKAEKNPKENDELTLEMLRAMPKAEKRILRKRLKALAKKFRI